MEEYLSNCIIPAGMKINMCKEFLSEVVTRFPEAHMHIYLLDFLEKVAARYKKDNCVDKFIFDLLLLRVPKLFSGKRVGCMEMCFAIIKVRHIVIT